MIEDHAEQVDVSFAAKDALLEPDSHFNPAHGVAAHQPVQRLRAHRVDRRHPLTMKLPGGLIHKRPEVVEGQ